MTTNTNDDGHRGLMVQQNEVRALQESGGGGGWRVAEVNQGLKKGPWTAVEDQILTEYVRKHGEGNWNSLQRNSGLNRCGKSCRLRWANHLRPHLKKGAFSPEEERLILELHAKYGNKWARMASQLPGRTDNEIKNYWNTRVKKRQRQGRPLYPHDIQKSHPISNFQSTGSPSTIQNPAFQLGTTPTFRFQGNHCKPPPLPPTQPSLSMSPLSSPHQSNSSTNTPSSFIFNGSPPTHGVGPPLAYKSYRDCAGFSPPISPNPQRNSSILRTSSMPDIAAAMSGISTSSPSSMPDISGSFHQLPPGINTIFHDIIPSFHKLTAETNNYSLNNNNINIGLASFDQFPATTFNPPFPPFPHSRFEYPDTILSSTGSLYSDQVALGPKAAAVATADFQQINPTSNGLYDDLLLEADRAFTYYDNSMQSGSSFEEKHATLDPYGGHGRLPPSTFMDSSSLEAKQQADDNNLGINSMPEDLSELFSFSPSKAEPASAADRYSASGDFSNVHCSGLTVANNLDDMQLSFLVDINSNMVLLTHNN